MSDQETIIGRVTANGAPELRYTPSGKAVANLSIRVPGKKANAKYGVEAAEAYFIDVVIWEKMAEHAAESIVAGDDVIVVGRRETRTWESNGEAKSKEEIIARNIGLDITWHPVTVDRAERTEGAPALAAF